jgi:hypothetical protein
MEQIPSGTELARPFVPAKDFELSKAFYEELSFEKLLDGDCGDLQDRFQRFHPATQV